MAWTGLTDQNLHNEIQYHLLETPNSGSSYGSGLYTSAEVQARINLRLNELSKRTGFNATRSTAISSTANVQTQSVPADFMDMIRVSFADTNGVKHVIPRGSTTEANKLIQDIVGSDAAVDVPYIYTTDTGDGVPGIVLYPPPSASRTLDYIYLQRPTALNSTPNGTALGLPKDLCPFVKYGALADLFNKTGEAYDPERAGLCQQLFELGVQLVQSYTYGFMQ